MLSGSKAQIYARGNIALDWITNLAKLAGYVHCLGALTGKRYWYHNVRSPIWASPFNADGKVYLGADDETVYVFSHGKRKRLLAENLMPSCVRGAIVANNGVVFVASGGWLFAIEKPKKN